MYIFFYYQCTKEINFIKKKKEYYPLQFSGVFYGKGFAFPFIFHL